MESPGVLEIGIHLDLLYLSGTDLLLPPTLKTFFNSGLLTGRGRNARGWQSYFIAVPR